MRASASARDEEYLVALSSYSSTENRELLRSKTRAWPPASGTWIWVFRLGRGCGGHPHSTGRATGRT
jgi:hypothetical protein